jgi:hypothetical protein
VREVFQSPPLGELLRDLRQKLWTYVLRHNFTRSHFGHPIKKPVVRVHPPFFLEVTDDPRSNRMTPPAKRSSDLITGVEVWVARV